MLQSFYHHVDNVIPRRPKGVKRSHTLRTLACRLRPKLKLIAHGCLRPTSSAAVLFMRSRFTVASSSDCPPDRKNTPGTAGGTRLRKVRSVSSAVRAGLACKHARVGQIRASACYGRVELFFFCFFFSLEKAPYPIQIQISTKTESATR